MLGGQPAAEGSIVGGAPLDSDRLQLDQELIQSPEPGLEQGGSEEGGGIPGPAQRALLGVILAISLVIVGLAERDLQGRPEDQIHGNRFAWRLASLNAVGAFAYRRLGRR